MNFNNYALTLHLNHGADYNPRDSFLTISPNKRKSALAKTGLKSNLKKTWLSRSIEDLSIDISKASHDERRVKTTRPKKKKCVTFQCPETEAENEAAVLIQRIARGGWQRIKYRITWLQHQLDTTEERTKASIDRVEDRTLQRKRVFRAKMEKKHNAEKKRATQVASLAQETQNIIEFLRKENAQLRKKNDKIAKAIKSLKEDNARIERANATADSTVSSLAERTKEIEETNAKLLRIEPMYKESVETMREAVERRRQFCVAERKIKLGYLKAVGNAVEMVEDGCRDISLANQVVDLCLQLEGEHENEALPLPPKIGDFLNAESSEGSSSSDDEDYDEYTIHTLD